MASLAAGAPASDGAALSRRIRLIAALGLTGLTLIAATGVVAAHAFHEPTTLKYLVTVLAPLLLIVLCLAEDPLSLALGATVITAPWNVNVTISSIKVSPLTVLVALSVLVALLEPRSRPRSVTATGSVVALALALLLPSFVIGRELPHYFTWIAYTLAAGWLAFTASQRPGGLRLILSLLVLSCGVQGILAIYEYSRHANLNLYSSEVNQTISKSYFFNFGEQFRPEGLLPDPDSLGNMMALTCPLALGLALSARTRLSSLLWIGTGGVIAVALTLSFSRASWIGAAAGVALALLAVPPRLRLPGLAGIAALSVVAVLVGLTVGGTSLRERFSSISNPTARTVRTARGDEERKQIWTAALDTASSHPVVGVGMGRLQEHLSENLGAAPEGLHAQSVYFQFLAQSGAVGLLALLMLLGHAATGVIRGLGRERVLMAGIAGGILAMLVTWTTETSARYTSVSVLLAFMLGAAMAEHARPRSHGRATIRSRAAVLIRSPPTSPISSSGIRSGE